MSLILNGDGSIQSLVAGGLPAGTVTQASLASGVAGTGPAFSAYQSVSQSVTANVFTKIQFQTELFDTNNNFDNVTNYRFTPTVAGYYLITANLAYSTAAVAGMSIIGVTIYKNGSAFSKGTQVAAGAINNAATSVTSVIYFNGSTDYVEIFSYQNVGTLSTLPADGGNAVRFEGYLVRSA